jgi:hypothetical protein
MIIVEGLAIATIIGISVAVTWLAKNKYQPEIERLLSSMVITVVAFTLVLGGTHTVLSTSETSNTRVAAGGNGSSWDSFSPEYQD